MLPVELDGPPLARELRQVPHPIPYQGSKRRIAGAILDLFPRRSIRTLIEPFAGSAALTIAAAMQHRASKYHINDSLRPLAGLWELIIQRPLELADRYERIWIGHVGNPIEHFYKVRSQFNIDQDPAKLLYLLTRCVKSAIRFNDKGEFNQSADRRRIGARPERIRREILGAHGLLKDAAHTTSHDYRDVLLDATRHDLVYMDPPWQGTSGARDTRYHQLLDKDGLITQLDRLNSHDVPFLLSFDGRLGERSYGDGLPASLRLTHLEICAGVSSQSTLSGQQEVTYESLYVSMAVTRALDANHLTALLREHGVGNKDNRKVG